MRAIAIISLAAVAEREAGGEGCAAKRKLGKEGAYSVCINAVNIRGARAGTILCMAE